MIIKNNDRTKGLWQIYTDAQEQILRANAIPISVLPNSTRPTNGKVTLKVDETNKVDALLERMANAFGIQREELLSSQHYFFVDKGRIPSLDTRMAFSAEAESNHIKFRPLPVIDGVIRSNDKNIQSFTAILLESNYDYSYDRKGRLQIALSDLDDLKGKVIQSPNINISIPDKATAIFQLHPSPLYFLNSEYPNIPWSHNTKVFIKDENRNIIMSSQIELQDGFLNDELLEHLKGKLGLYLNEFTLAFSVDRSLIKEDIPSGITMPKYNKEEGAFIITLKKNHSRDNEFFEDASGINYAYTFYRRILGRYYGKENVSLKFSRFCYRYDVDDFIENYLSTNSDWKEGFWESIYNTLAQSNVSVSLPTETIGVDFNWKEDSISDILADICQNVPIALLSYYPNHKCNIDVKIQDSTLDLAETSLREQFPSIQISRNDWTGDLLFYQEYSNSHQYDRILRALEHQIAKLDIAGYNITINEIPSGKEKFIFKVDENSLRDTLAESVKSMRGKEFNISEHLKFGKLTRVSYPLVTFTLDNPEDEAILQLLEEGGIGRLYPDITGDLEKISRLKNAFNNIVNGTGLKNKNLSEFIFDSSKAKPIENIEFYINPQSDYYKDFEAHRLNERITESQLKAIIKAVNAEDLAVIQGPPGTGKSTAIAEIIWQHVRLNPEGRILLTSETNLAVDNAIDRIVNKRHNLVKPIRIGDDSRLVSEGRQFSIEAMQAWVANGVVLRKKHLSNEDYDSTDQPMVQQDIILNNWIENILRRSQADELDESTYHKWHNFLSRPSKEVRQILFDQYIQHCNVIGATCSSIGEKSTKGTPTGFYRQYCQIYGKVENKVNRDGKPYRTYAGDVRFDTVIQDESSKATPAELSLPLIYGKKNIVIGDQRQLPPLLDREQFHSSFDFLLREVEDKHERRKLERLKKYVDEHFDEMEISHFQRLIESIHHSLKGVFNTQYRMHWAINDVISQFYEDDGGLSCGLEKEHAEDENIANPHSRYHGIEIEGLIRPTDHIIWVDTRTPEIQDGTSRVNYGEIEVIRKILEEFSNSETFKNYQNLWNCEDDKEIGLISFYGKQIKHLYQLSKSFPDMPLKIDTVDRFQGMEKNIIIVSMVRSSCIAADKEQQPDYELYGPLGYPEQNDFGFAQSPNRLNVALSRAKRLLIIVGNSSLFRRKGIYDNVYKIIDNSKCGNIIKPESEWIGKI